MISWQRLFSVMVALGTVAQDLYAMEFDFRPLSSLCRIEVNLATGFGSGTIRGTFGKMKGTLFFSPENPQQTEGRILLASRSLRFGYPKVAYDTHAPDWLDSTNYPEILFQLKGLQNFSWHGKELRAEAKGQLSIKGVKKTVTIPMSIHYFRGERRKYEGKKGDLLRLDGILRIPRSEFGLSPHNHLDVIMENIDIMVSITGASNQIRPLLPSRLFQNQ
jgi:polyisoprenoid-binding protein YceI